MSGTKEGGQKAHATNIKRDPEFYGRIGKIGGSKSGTGGFGSDKVGKDGLTGKERARVVGTHGGRKSRRGPQVRRDYE